MHVNNTVRVSRPRRSASLIIAFAAVAILTAGCNETSAPVADNGIFDSSRLPRVTGAKEVFASPATTIFTSPDPVTQTADKVETALKAIGWQKYIAPNTAYANDPNSRILSLKKGQQALSVFVTVAPAQNNATSAQFSALPLKTDLPFTADASAIEYSPERGLLTLVTAEPIDKTLDFYRKEMSARGWALWSEKTNGKQGDGGPSGVVHESGAYSHYVTDKDPSVAIVLTVLKADGGKSKVDMKQWPIGILEPLHQAYVNSDNHRAVLADVAKLPRLEGAQEDAGRSSKDKSVYSIAAPLADTTAALIKLLGADGWKPYVAPLEDSYTTLMNLKKGGQALSVSFTIQPGKNERTSQVTTVSYSPARLQFALAAPDDATDLVFDANRPYLNLTTAGTIDVTREFYGKQFAAAGWSPLSATDATAKWPNAKLDTGATYYDRGNKRPIMLTTQRVADKTNVEIKVAPFALAQDLQADSDVFGLPRPKPSKTSGGTDGRPREVHAHVIAGIEPVLAFYRRELTARNWKEESQGAKITADEVVLNFSPPEGSAVLKLSRKYDLTVASIVQQIPAAAPKPAPAPGRVAQDDTIGNMLKDAQQMMRDAMPGNLPGNLPGAMPGVNPPQTPPANAPSETLRPRAGNDAPVPVPENAEDVEYSGDDGKLEFSSPSSVKSVADFYRAIMKQQGWGSQSSVINNANMVVLNFAKAGKAASFTIMKMGPKTNVSADGPALKVAGGKPKPADTPTADVASQPATDDDLIVEESGGLPMPKRHTLSIGDKTPFRRQLTVNVPLDLKTVLEFYRREFAKLNWKEESKGAAVAADNVFLAFTSAEGPATIKLSRKDGETIVTINAKDPGAAAKAGIAPSPGKVKILFGNILPADSQLTFNGKTVKVAGGAGTKAPDGPTVEVAPGTYKFSIKPAGKPAQNEEVVVGPDETWGLMIGPGGVLALQAY